jgi:hypothetical protein
MGTKIDVASCGWLRSYVPNQYWDRMSAASSVELIETIDDGQGAYHGLTHVQHHTYHFHREGFKSRKLFPFLINLNGRNGLEQTSIILEW